MKICRLVGKYDDDNTYQTHVFTGEDAEQDASRFAIHLIAEHTRENGWDAYTQRSIRKLKELVEEGRYLDARRHWNDIASYTLNVYSDQSHADVAEDFDFEWPEEEDDE